ncbi:unnamed protein product [Orchesella dallaii]|uniref:Gustatory receptor n=1 Tax=Orchesella dallaii TaxID=48710 RepID=A0ABP1S7E4_9HEXA
MLSHNHQRGILELINLVKVDDSFEIKISSNKNIRAIGNVVLIFLFCVGGPVAAHIYNNFKHGLENTMAVTWYGVSPSDIELRNSIAFFIVTAKTLDTACIQFTNSVRNAQKVGIVSREEVIKEYLRIRKVFSVVSCSLGPLLLMIVITGNLGACTNLVWVFRDTTMSNLSRFSTFNFICGFICLLWFSAHASNQLSLVLPFLSLRIPDPSCGSRNSNVLLRNIVIHEISSGSVGLKPCGIFVITYDFIARMMIILMSNAAIVLQNFDVIMTKWALMINKAETDNEQCRK